MSRYDAIIVGAGHNGLTAAFYLARAGLATLVLERRDIVGGCCVTEEIDPELAPGCRVSTASYIASMLRPEVIRDMDLSRHGLAMKPCDPGVQAVLEDGRIVSWWSDPELFRTELKRVAPDDVDAFFRLDSELKAVAACLQPWFLEPPPNVHARGFARVRELLRAARRLGTLDGDGTALLVELLTASLAEFVNRRFDSAALKGLLLANSLYGKHGGPYEAGTAVGLLFHLLSGGEEEQQGFYGHVFGGMGAITQAMAAACAEQGVHIRCSTPVAAIETRDGHARGVRLEDGSEIEAKVVLSNADPRRTFLKLLAKGTLAPDFERRVRAIRMDGPCGKVNFVLRDAPLLRGLSADAPAGQRALFTLVPDYATTERNYHASRAGQLPERLWVDCVVPSLIDDSLTPDNRHVMTCFVQYLPFELAAGDWDTHREALGDQVQATIEQYVPGFSASVLARQVITPLDLERRFAITEGNIFHGDIATSSLFFLRPAPGWAHYRTPVKGLYLCGAGAHPGGGVTAAPGHNAARQVLKDWDAA